MRKLAIILSALLLVGCATRLMVLEYDKAGKVIRTIEAEDYSIKTPTLTAVPSRWLTPAFVGGDNRRSDKMVKHNPGSNSESCSCTNSTGSGALPGACTDSNTYTYTRTPGAGAYSDPHPNTYSGPTARGLYGIYRDRNINHS